MGCCLRKGCVTQEITCRGIRIDYFLRGFQGFLELQLMICPKLRIFLSKSWKNWSFFCHFFSKFARFTLKIPPKILYYIYTSEFLKSLLFLIILLHKKSVSTKIFTISGFFTISTFTISGFYCSRKLSSPTWLSNAVNKSIWSLYFKCEEWEFCKLDTNNLFR